MKILLLGGTGAMGIPVSEKLSKDGHSVYITTRVNRTCENKNIHYIVGNARDIEFLKEVLVEEWDAIVDFMIYSTEDFKKIYRLFLKSTKQYFYISSARVYANSDVPITEESRRIWDIKKNEKGLNKDEYCIRKAMQEDILIESNTKNWTIIRPYITYNNERLQLGVLEKENWLDRAMKGKTIVFSKDIAKKSTTLTYGNDVADFIVRLIGNKSAYGEIFHITGDKVMQWDEILCIYLNAIEKATGNRPRVKYVDDSNYFKYITGNYYPVIYDRLYNRVFDNSKIMKTLSCSTYDWITPDEGLENCVMSFINSSCKFGKSSCLLEGYHDKVTKEKRSIVFNSDKEKIQYLVCRYVPSIFLKIFRKIK